MWIFWAVFLKGFQFTPFMLLNHMPCKKGTEPENISLIYKEESRRQKESGNTIFLVCNVCIGYQYVLVGTDATI